MADNLQDLMAAANQKLAAQKKEQARGDQPVEANDIYAEMRREAEEPDIDYGTAPEIQHSPSGFDGIPQIEYEPQSEDPVFVDMELDSAV